MGAGKSSVGRLLKKQYGLPFLDTDAVIMAKTGLAPSVIFEKFGETYFRDLESSVLKEDLPEPPYVLSTGGGMVLSAENRQKLRQTGCVFWLKVSAETVRRRLRKDTSRPLLKGSSVDMDNLMAFRDPIYAKTSHFSVQSGGHLKEVAEVIGSCWEKLESVPAVSNCVLRYASLQHR